MADGPTVSMLDLKAQHGKIKAEMSRAIAAVFESQVFIGGPEVGGFEREIAELCGTTHGVACASGSEAILLAMMALGVGRGDEVICPAYTFFSTAGSIARLGAVPVFADIDPVTFNLEVTSVREAAGRCTRLKAIMPVHLFGRAADLDPLLAMCDELDVPLIEDAAQAIGCRDESGRPVGSIGAMATFSFYPTKNLGGCGDGGMVVTGDSDLFDRLMRLRDHGGSVQYTHDMIGLNSRLDALQAAALRVKLRHLHDWNRARRANADAYDRLFAGARGVRVPARPQNPDNHVFHQYVIRVPEVMRDPLREHLQTHGIGTAIYYPIPLHLQECFAYLGYSRGDLPVSETLALESLALPVHAELRPEQIEHVAATTIEFLGKQVEVEVLPRAEQAPAQR